MPNGVAFKKDRLVARIAPFLRRRDDSGAVLRWNVGEQSEIAHHLRSGLNDAVEVRTATFCAGQFTAVCRFHESPHPSTVKSSLPGPMWATSVNLTGNGLSPTTRRQARDTLPSGCHTTAPTDEVRRRNLLPCYLVPPDYVSTAI